MAQDQPPSLAAVTTDHVTHVWSGNLRAAPQWAQPQWAQRIGQMVNQIVPMACSAATSCAQDDRPGWPRHDNTASAEFARLSPRRSSIPGGTERGPQHRLDAGLVLQPSRPGMKSKLPPRYGSVLGVPFTTSRPSAEQHDTTSPPTPTARFTVSSRWEAPPRSRSPTTRTAS